MSTTPLPEHVFPLPEDLFPDARTVLAVRGVDLGPDVTATHGQWAATVVALPLHTGVRFEIEAARDDTGSVYATVFARDVELIHTPTHPADLAALFVAHGPALVTALHKAADAGELTARDTLAAAVSAMPSPPAMAG